MKLLKGKNQHSVGWVDDVSAPRLFRKIVYKRECRGLNDYYYEKVGRRWVLMTKPIYKSHSGALKSRLGSLARRALDILGSFSQMQTRWREDFALILAHFPKMRRKQIVKDFERALGSNFLVASPIGPSKLKFVESLDRAKNKNKTPTNTPR